MKSVFLYLCSIVSATLIVYPVNAIDSVEKLYASLFENYDKTIRPNYGAQPVVVGITLYVLAISDINEKQMEFTFNAYFRETWEDKRLAFTPAIYYSGNNQSQTSSKIITTLQLHGDRVDSVWEPDTFLVNEVRSFQHQLFMTNKLVRIYNNGTILKSSRYTITASCPMNLQYFPFDNQVCSAEIESYGYTTEDIAYKWHKDKIHSVGISYEASMPNFVLSKYRLRVLSESLSTGNYSRLVLDFHFLRSHGMFMTRYYTPMFLFVGVSLLSQWILSPRISALISLIDVCLVNLFIAEFSSYMPEVSYATGIDVYFSLCIGHIIVSIIFALIGAYLEEPTRLDEAMELQQRRRASEDAENLCPQAPTIRAPTRRKFFGVITFIDILRILKAFLLIGFMISNITYFSVYTSHSKEAMDSYDDDFVPF